MASYATKTIEHLAAIPLDHSLLCCQETACTNINHRLATDFMYKSIICSLYEAEVSIAGDVRVTSHPPVPG